MSNIAIPDLKKMETFEATRLREAYAGYVRIEQSLSAAVARFNGFKQSLGESKNEYLILREVNDLETSIRDGLNMLETRMNNWKHSLE